MLWDKYDYYHSPLRINLPTERRCRVKVKVTKTGFYPSVNGKLREKDEILDLISETHFSKEWMEKVNDEGESISVDSVSVDEVKRPRRNPNWGKRE